MSKENLKSKIDSTRAAVLIVLYNCLILPVCCFVIVFAWRAAVGSVYGYAKYDPATPVFLFLLVAVLAEIVAAAILTNSRNGKGMIIGFGISLLLSPLLLFAVWFSIMLGNR